MYTYRKPKNAKHAIELVEAANVNVLWDICNPNNIEMSEKYFSMYTPIVFIYKNDKLVGAAHGKHGARPTVIDINDRDVTSTYNKLLLAEIDTELKQLELF
jgi:hypothetical protein